MNGLMLMGLATLVFLVAAAAIVLCAIGALRFIGAALNKNRPPAQRQLRAVLAALCLFGMVASAGAGFLGIASLMFEAAVQDDLPHL